jgi:hypothetical protein
LLTRSSGVKARPKSRTLICPSAVIDVHVSDLVDDASKVRRFERLGICSAGPVPPRQYRPMHQAIGRWTLDHSRTMPRTDRSPRARRRSLYSDD